MTVMIGHAGSDEYGGISGGKAGDQKQHGTPDHSGEVYMRNWWLHNLGWRVFRCKDAAKADMIAQDMEWACNNPNIGYDQSQNQTLLYVAEKVDYDCSKVKTPCETDCARLVRVCVLYAKIHVSDFYTGIEASALLATGMFEELTGSKYTTSDEYLKRGDILVTKTTGHTLVVLSNGSKAEEATIDSGVSGSYKVTTALNMRKGAGTNYGVMKVLKANEVIYATGAVETVNGSKWYQVKAGTEVGWCNSNYLKFAGTTSPDTMVPAYYAASVAGDYKVTTGLNLRRGVGTGYKIVKVLPQNAIVKCQGFYGKLGSVNWPLVKYDGFEGYCSSKYLKKV